MSLHKVDEDGIVDFKEEESIIRYLKESKDELDVISISGMAAQTNVNRKLVDLSPLESEKSLQLLKVKVFGSAKTCPGELEDIGQAIANKCGGVPLIIVVIGGVLKLQFTDTRAIPGLKEKWLDVLRNVDNILFQDENKFISDVLELSYSILPDDLRMCFLYTGLFPENHDIPASTLTQLWIAEGFIQRQDGQSFEENADKILDTLINMNLLTVAKKNLDQVKTCGVHDMIREFCRAKATEQNLFRVMKKSRDGVIEPSVAELPKFRRLCLHSDPLRFLSEKPKGPCVRSFLCFFNEPFDLDATHLSTIPDAFNLLRVLSCKSIKFRQFPEVTKLKLLKHITLFIDNLIVLPEQFSQLINLQTLIVETNSRSIKAKANIWKMIQLRRLKAKAAISLNGKKWEGKASENLQTISRLSPDSCVAALSKRAPNLKTLGIQGKVANLFNTFSLQEFHRLEKLKLVNDLDRASASENPLLALPQWSHFPPILKRLTLSKTYLDWGRHMPILAQINTLKVLKLKDNAFAGAFWIADDAHNSFQELQFLLIENSDLVIWNPSTTHFRSLTWLVLKKCKKLEKIPGSLAENLEKLEIEGVKKSAAESARKIESAANKKQEEKHKWVVPFKLTVGPECDL